MACTVRNDNETQGSIKVTEILDQNFGSCILKKDAAPWSKGEDIPVHTTKACGEAEERRYSFLRKFGKSGVSVQSAIPPGRPSPNEEAPIHPLNRKMLGLLSLS